MKTKIIATALLIGIGGLVAATVPPAETKETWDKQCAKCHGKEGAGDTKIGKKMGAKDYTDPKVEAELKDEDAIKSLKEGLKDEKGKTVMKPFDKLSDDEIKALVGYMRDFSK